ncbi:translation initiation factor Sui1 [Planctomycetota bacterium]
MGRKNNGGLVYSTAHGRMCPGCSQPIDTCICKQQPLIPLGDGIVRVGRETKGRKGKGVTVVTGLALDPKKLTRLAKQLKQRCGAGGTVKDGVIEIQGDHRDTLVEELQKLGHTVKRSGG